MRVCFTMTRLLFLSLCALVAGSVQAADGYSFARAPYLQFSTTNSIYVVWRTAGPIKPMVKFGKEIKRLNHELSYVSPDSGTGILARASLGEKKEAVPSKWQQYRT